MADVLAELVVKLRADTAGLNKGLKSAENRLASAGKSMTAAGKKMSMFITAPIVGIGIAAFKMSGDFDLAFRKVNVMLKASTEEAKEYKKRILEISSATGKSADDVVNAFYQIVSAGYRGADSLDILNTAMMGATGGAADATAATSALTKAMNIFELKGVEGASRAMDVFFGIVDAGLLTFEQMAKSFPMAATMAAGLNVQIEEVGAALATLTRVSGSTEQASTALNAVFTQLIKPSADLMKLYERWGIKTGPEAIKKFGGFEGVLIAVQEATGGNVDTLAKLFPNVEAIRAILPLTTTSAQEFADALDTVRGSTGRTSEAFDEMTTGPGFQWQQMMVGLKNTSIKLGDALAGVLGPIVVSFTEKLHALVDWFVELTPAMRGTILKIVGLVAGLGPLLLILGSVSRGLGGLIVLLVKARTALIWMRIASTNLTATMGILGAALIAASALVYLFTRQTDALTSATKGLAQAQIEQFAAQSDAIEELATGQTVVSITTERMKELAEAVDMTLEEFLRYVDLVPQISAGTEDLGYQVVIASGVSADFRDVLAEVTEEIERQTEAIPDLTVAQGQLNQGWEDFLLDIQPSTKAFRKFGLTAEDVTYYMMRTGRSIEEVIDDLKAQGIAVNDVQYHLDELGISAKEVADFVGKKASAVRDETEADKEATVAILGMGDAHDKAADSINRTAESLRNQTAAMAESIAATKAGLREVAAGGATAEERMAGGLAYQRARMAGAKEVAEQYGVDLATAQYWLGAPIPKYKLPTWATELPPPWEFPGFKQGGIVTQPTVGLLGEAGPEAIIPLSKGGLGGDIHLHFNGHTFFDREDSVNKFVEKLRPALRRADRLNYGGAYTG